MTTETNKQAVRRGESIVHSNERRRNGYDQLESVLLDLLHYAAAKGEDFDEPLRYAREAFEQETKEDGPQSL